MLFLDGAQVLVGEQTGAAGGARRSATLLRAVSRHHRGAERDRVDVQPGARADRCREGGKASWLCVLACHVIPPGNGAPGTTHRWRRAAAAAPDPPRQLLRVSTNIR